MSGSRANPRMYQGDSDDAVFLRTFCSWMPGAPVRGGINDG